MDPTSQYSVAIGASSLLGLSVVLFVTRLRRIIHRHRQSCPEAWDFEEARRVRLRCGSRVYEWFEPLIDELAGSRLVSLFNLDRTALALSRGGDPLPWKPREFIGISLMQVLLLFLGFDALVAIVLPVHQALLTSAILSSVALLATLRELSTRATGRLEAIHARLPHCLDLIAVMMQAGADFENSLATAVAESGDHPFAEEFRRVLEHIRRGRTLADALGDLDQRLRSPDVRELMQTVNNAQELGTPLMQMLFNMSDQVRLQRVQRAEAAAGRAQANIQFPGLLIMLGCLLIVAVPFILGAINNW